MTTGDPYLLEDPYSLEVGAAGSPGLVIEELKASRKTARDAVDCTNTPMLTRMKRRRGSDLAADQETGRRGAVKLAVRRVRQRRLATAQEIMLEDDLGSALRTVMYASDMPASELSDAVIGLEEKLRASLTRLQELRDAPMSAPRAVEVLPDVMTASLAKPPSRRSREETIGSREASPRQSAMASHDPWATERSNKLRIDSEASSTLLSLQCSSKAKSIVAGSIALVPSRFCRSEAARFKDLRAAIAARRTDDTPVVVARPPLQAARAREGPRRSRSPLGRRFSSRAVPVGSSISVSHPSPPQSLDEESDRLPLRPTRSPRPIPSRSRSIERSKNNEGRRRTIATADLPRHNLQSGREINNQSRLQGGNGNTCKHHRDESQDWRREAPLTVRRRSRTRSRSRGKTLSDVVARPTRSSKVRGHEGSHSPSQQHRRSYNAMDSFHHERNSEDRKSLPSRQRDQNSVHSRSRSPQFRHQATLPRERSLSAARGHGNVKTALPRPSSACDDSVSPSRGYSLSRMIPASSKPSLPPPPTRPGSVHNDCEDKQGQIEVIKDDDEEETSPSQVVPPTSTIDFRKRLDALRSRPTAPARAPTDEEIEI